MAADRSGAVLDDKTFIRGENHTIHMGETDTKQVKSVRTTFSILEYLRDEGPAGVTEISKEVGMSKGAVHRYLTTLTDLGYTQNQDGTYQIGLNFISFGYHAKNREHVFQLAEEKLSDLAEETGERAQFIAEEHGRGVYVHLETGENAVNTDTREGKVINLSTSAAGKAILAFSPESRLESVLDEHGFSQRTLNTITDKEQLFEELEEIRERGCAFNREEHIKGLWGAAAPVRSSGGDVLGAISVAGPADRVKEQMINDEIPSKIRGVVNEIELNLRYD